METCVRGFSYMPESKLDVNLQYIEDGELERAWKVNRRQRVKDQEQRIWEEFVKEQDIVRKVYTEDPYQFLHELPENCLKELMEEELSKMKKDTKVMEEVVEQPKQGEGDHPAEKQVVHSVVHFAEDEKPDLDMFHIFDDENEFNQSGGEDDQPESPSTVRECPPPPAACPPDVPVAVKSTENVSNVIESSIYCARVKDIRLKLTEEMVAIMASLEVPAVESAERADLARRCRRAADFSARFNRIYMYQLQRQAHTISRHVSQAAPLAQHTHFRAQMSRVASLHHNMLQALQVFHKSFPATWCLRECARALSALAALVRDVTALCRAAPAPRDFLAAKDLYDDELVQTCDKLEGALADYSLRVADFLGSSDFASVDLNTAPSSTRAKKSKKGLTYTKTGSKTLSTKDTDARLSMYSLDTLRINLHPKTTTSRDYQSSGTSKGRASPSAATNKPQSEKDKSANTIIRRPLMRALQCGGRGRARGLRARRHDGDIPTMVQAVDTCESAHAMFTGASPTPRDTTPRDTTPRDNTPRARSPRHHVSRQVQPQHSPRFAQKASPRSNQRILSPVVKPRRSSPRPRPALRDPATPGRTPITPVTRIQCAKRQPRNRSPAPGKTTDSSRNEKISARGKKSERDHRGDATIADGDSGERDKSGGRGKVDEDDDGEVDTVVPSGQVERAGHIGNPGKEDNTGRDFTDHYDHYSGSYATELDDERNERGRNKTRGHMAPARCDVPRLLRQLCSGDPAGTSNERVTGAKNAQLLCIRGGSPPGQPSTPQLLRILEETIQKQSPRPIHVKPRNPERYRLNFNIPETSASRMFQYRTKFVQHMLTSPLYANSVVGKPWEVIGSVSDKIIDDLLTNIAKEMEINHVLRGLYKCETN